MNRTISKYLHEWKEEQNRLVLLVRGARQVGKTYSIRQLATSFKHYVEVNFLERPRVAGFFEGDLSAATICEKLSTFYGVPIIPGETLLFFDEIQDCPACLKSLRFFREQMSSLHVIGAGSMLELVLKDLPSFGVGRIASLYMYPLSFREFLIAEGSASVESYVFSHTDMQPVDNVFHEQLLEKLRVYLMVGGMPAVVASYVESRNIRRCQELLDALLQTLWTDFAKYTAVCPVMTLRDTFWSVARQAGGKFVYSHVGPDCTRHMAKIATDLLSQVNLIHQVFHTSAQGIPLGAQTDRSRFKALPLDLGLHQRMLGLDLSAQLLDTGINLVNKGALAEAFVGLELLSGNSPMLRPQLHYWHREEPGSNAEVDYVIQRNERVIPIEVKSGTRGSMQSMRRFMMERNTPLGLRLSHENVGRYTGILALPLYFACLLPLAWSQPDTNEV